MHTHPLILVNYQVLVFSFEDGSLMTVFKVFEEDTGDMFKVMFITGEMSKGFHQVIEVFSILEVCNSFFCFHVPVKL